MRTNLNGGAMKQDTYLVLEDGSIYKGQSIGALGSTQGEVVFNTSMTGYQEMLTDPSYSGQIVIPTYPLIGNYGINDVDIESKKIQVSGFVVRGHCDAPSNLLSKMTIHQYLASKKIVGISGVDTRAITKKLRTSGVMMGMITTAQSTVAAIKKLRKAPRYDDTNFISQVTTPKAFTWQSHNHTNGKAKYKIAICDFGVKYNIMRILEAKGCEVITYPSQTPARDILSINPDGVLLSPGPGDPALLEYNVKVVKELIGKVPIMGICLGHQILGRAFGGQTYKLKFGHRGANHPVKDTYTGLISITSQNHGFALSGDGLPAELEVSHLHINDGTIEGLRHKSLPIMSIQYHSEASPGPKDNEYLFDNFLKILTQHKDGDF